jgi:hypothetical protein
MNDECGSDESRVFQFIISAFIVHNLIYGT